MKSSSFISTLFLVLILLLLLCNNPQAARNRKSKHNKKDSTADSNASGSSVGESGSSESVGETNSNTISNKNIRNKQKTIVKLAVPPPQVFEKDNWYYLTFGNTVQNVVYCTNEMEKVKQGEPCIVDNTKIKLVYTQSMAVVGAVLLSATNGNDVNVFEKTKALYIGLGMGALPRFYHHYFPKMEMDIVEINAELVDKVKSRFPFTDYNDITIYVEDALKYVNRITNNNQLNKRYNIIFHDAYDDDGHVESLNTIPFLRQLRTLLENPDPKTSGLENGIIVGNYWTNNMTQTQQVLERYQKVFSYVRVYGVPGASAEPNCIFVAHSPIKDNQFTCVDNMCEKTKGKKKSKKSAICEDVSKLLPTARRITENFNIEMDFTMKLETAWTNRPVFNSTSLC